MNMKSKLIKAIRRVHVLRITVGRKQWLLIGSIASDDCT